MISALINRRATAVLVSAGALLLAALAAAPQAEAQTLYACVKKDGSAHIFTKRPRCKRHEAKLSWNRAGTNGAAGKEGAPGKEGKEGAAGKNGAVAGYAAAQTSSSNLVGTKETVVQIPGLSKALPAGSFIVSANIRIEGASETAGAEVGAFCELVDTPSSGPATRQSGGWASAVTVKELFGEYFAEGELALHLAVSTATNTSTVRLLCAENAEEGGKELAINAYEGTIVAVQTSKNS